VGYLDFLRLLIDVAYCLMTFEVIIKSTFFFLSIDYIFHSTNTFYSFANFYDFSEWGPNLLYVIMWFENILCRYFKVTTGFGVEWDQKNTFLKISSLLLNRYLIDKISQKVRENTF